MVKTEFQDMFETLVKNEWTYIEVLRRGDKDDKETLETLRAFLGAKELDEWTVMSKVYDFAYDNFCLWNHMIVLENSYDLGDKEKFRLH